MKTIRTLSKIVAVAILFISNLSVNAQIPDRLRPDWWFGVSGAANFDFYNGTVSKVPYGFSNGNGVAPYISVFTEYRPGPVWGFMFNVALDDHYGVFNNNDAPAGINPTLKTDLDYISVEPSLRIAPFSGNFYLFVGPRLNFNIEKSFVLEPEIGEQDDNKLSDVYPMRVSAQVGAGYDIPLSRPMSTTQVNLSPFVAFSPYFGNQPQSSGNLDLTILRVGIAIKLGGAPEPPYPQASVTPVQEHDVQFSVQPPAYVPSQGKVNENLPITNAVFFDAGNTNIPSRYTLLTKDQAGSFTEAQLQDCQKMAATHSERQLAVYYNILNIIGDRMRKNPESTIKLIGSSAGKGEQIGEANAASVKDYLVNNFGIDPGRIETEGRNMPLIPSEKYNGTKDKDLTMAEDNRVDIVSNSPDLVTEAADNTAICLKPTTEPMAMDGSSPGDAKIVIDANGALGTLLYWSIDVKDDSGNVQHFGTFSGDMGTISSAALLKDKKSGNYTIVMNGETYLGHTVTKEASFTLKSGAAEPAEQEQTSSVLFDFDKSNATATYENFLTNTVASLIPPGATVIIDGHTDIIGTDEHNMKLSVDRANEAQKVLSDALDKAGKTGVVFKATGYGAANPPFDNALPEQRFYNRTVTIEIVPPNQPVAVK